MDATHIKGYSKVEKQRLRKLAGLAYERELKNSLSVLAAIFEWWNLGKVTSFQMEEEIHKYDRDESRKLWSLYNTPRTDFLVARAVAIGLLTEDEVGTTILNLIAQYIDLYKNEPSAA
jgi:hypothetical protein